MDMDTDAMEDTLQLEVQDSSNEQELQFVDAMQMFSIIESVLFASDKALSLATLKQVFHGTNIDTKTIKNAMDEMMRIYADPTRGVTLEEVVGGWQLRTKLDNIDFLKKIARTRPFRLSGPALEVLSIIAYKQPIIKHEVDQIRGVESGHLVRALMDKGLVSFEGKTELPGKPMAYSTTRKFLEIFGLRNINELPSLGEIDQLLPDGIGEEEEEKETLSDVTQKMSEQVGAGSYSEGEEELLEITGKLSEINTSTEFFEQEKQRQKAKRDRERAEDIREAIAMGELVEDKDRRWLEKYEEQLQAAATVAQELTAIEQGVAAQGAESIQENTDREEVDELEDATSNGMLLEANMDMPQDLIEEEAALSTSAVEESEEGV